MLLTITAHLNHSLPLLTLAWKRVTQAKAPDPYPQYLCHRACFNKKWLYCSLCCMVLKYSFETGSNWGLLPKMEEFSRGWGSPGWPLPIGHPRSLAIDMRRNFITAQAYWTELWKKGHFVFKCFPLTGFEWREEKKTTENPSSDEKDKFSKTVTDAQSRYRRKNATKIRLARWISAADSISKPNYSSLFPSHTLLPIIAKLSQPTAPLPTARTHEPWPGAWCCQHWLTQCPPLMLMKSALV